MVDPDGNRVRLVPPGHDGITPTSRRMAVRSLQRTPQFYGDILGFRRTARGRAVRPFASETASFFWAKTAPRPSTRLVRHSAGATSPCRSPISTPSIRSAKQGRARGSCAGNTWRRGADIDDPRSGRQLDRAISPGLDRRQPVLNDAASDSQRLDVPVRRKEALDFVIAEMHAV